MFHVHKYPSCCGVNIIHGFPPFYSPSTEVMFWWAILESLKGHPVLHPMIENGSNTAEWLRGWGKFGAWQCILNDIQRERWEPFLLKNGFVKMGDLFKNPNTGNMLQVYQLEVSNHIIPKGMHKKVDEYRKKQEKAKVRRSAHDRA